MGLGFGLRASFGALAPWLGIAAGVAIAWTFLLWQLAEQEHGKELVAQPAAGGFEAEDALYVVGPVLWLGGASAFLVSAAVGAPLFALWFTFGQRPAIERASRGPEERA